MEHEVLLIYWIKDKIYIKKPGTLDQLKDNISVPPYNSYYFFSLITQMADFRIPNSQILSILYTNQ